MVKTDIKKTRNFCLNKIEITQKRVVVLLQKAKF